MSLQCRPAGAQGRDRLRTIAALCLAGLWVVSPAAVLAHDPPYVMSLAWSERPEEVFMWTNRGLIVGRADGGYSLLCTAALSVPSSEQVDMTRSADGAFVFATSGGLFRSDDSGCSLLGVEPLAATPIYALSAQPGADSRWLLVTGASEGRTVQASTDQGATWQPIADLADDEYFETLRFAPSDPSVVYADGLALGDVFTNFIALSSDGGATWQRRDLPLLESEGDATLLAVSPSDPQHLLVKAHDSGPELLDRLLLSLDGGQTYTAPLQQRDLASAAFSEDGSVVYVAAEEGLWVSADMGATFEQRAGPERMSYVAAHAGALLAVGHPQGVNTGFYGIGRSTDHGASFEPLMTFTDVDQPLDCPPGQRAEAACSGLWSDWASEFPEAVDPAPDAGDSPSPGDASVPGNGNPPPANDPSSQPQPPATTDPGPQPVAGGLAPPNAGADGTGDSAGGASCATTATSGRAHSSAHWLCVALAWLATRRLRRRPPR